MRTRFAWTKVSTLPGLTLRPGFDTLVPSTRTPSVEMVRAASVRVLKNRACQSHLSSRSLSADKGQPLSLSPISAAAKGLSGSIRSFFSGRD